MRARIRRLATYLGLVDDAREDLRLEHVRPALVASASWAAALAVVSTAFALTVLEWDIARAAVQAAAGTAIWGILYFLTDIRDHVPHGTLLEPPPGAGVEPPRLHLPRRLLLALPLGFGLAWLADRWDLGALFVPGQMLGFGTASVAGLALVLGWERRHHKRVVARSDEVSPGDLYAVPPEHLVAERRGPAPSNR